MIVRSLLGSKKVECPKGGFTSYRYLLENDGMGFTLTKTVIPAGKIETWHYENHLEACLCISGVGSLRDCTTGQIYRIEPGIMYALTEHEKHIFTAFTDVELICVFNPPLVGNEVHNERGVYERVEK